MGNGLRTAMAAVWTKRPLFCVAVSLVIGLLLEKCLSGAGWVWGFAFGVLLMWVVSWRSALVGACLIWLGLFSLKWHTKHYDEGLVWVSQQGLGSVEGRLLEDARVSEDGGWTARAQLHDSGFPARIVLWKGVGEAPVAGTELRAIGVFKELEADRNPGMSGREERLRAEGVVGQFQASEMRQEMWTGFFSEKMGALRKEFQKSIVRGMSENSEEAMVVRAVVLGEKSPDALELVAKFRDSGTLHAFTVSGLHVAMVGSLLWVLLRLIACPRRLGVIIIIAAMFAYVWLTGSGPAAMRAAWMGAVFLMAFLFRRRPDLLNSLGAVLIGSILWNPALLWLPGVQLSYGVVAAIGLGTNVAAKCFQWIAEKDDFMPKSEVGKWARLWSRFRAKTAEGLAVSSAATMGSIPLSVFHFGIVTPVSIFATVCLVPLVYLLLGAALVSSLVYPFVPSVSQFVNKGNALIAKSCIVTADIFARLPGGNFRTRSVNEETLVVYDLPYGADAACFSTPGRMSVMIDSGGDFGLKGEVGMSLRNQGMIPDSVIFTHVDAGHVSTEEIMGAMFPIRQAAMGMEKSRRGAAAGWYRAANHGLQVIEPKRGDWLELGSAAKAEVLYSPHDFLLGSESDDQVMVLMIHWRDWKILWLGDAGRLTEMWMIENRVNLSADVIVADCHDTDLSLTEPFLNAVHPKVIILPRLPGSEMDIYREERTAQLRKSKWKLIERNQTGGLTMTINQYDELVIKGHLDKSEVVLSRK